MSFSGDIKKELAKQLSEARHCQIAELAAIISICGVVRISENNQYSLKIRSENLSVARKSFTLIGKAFNMKTNVSIIKNTNKKNAIYEVVITGHQNAVKILQATKLVDRHGDVREELSLIHNIVVQMPCCKRAFIRGAFLAAGSISDPNKSYHFEIACVTEAKAKQLEAIINSFGVDSKIVLRKKYFVVYLKESAQIVDMLNIIEAHVALMELENIRILKEVRNKINRNVNCETANINKTVSAAIKQVNDITYLRDMEGFDNLSEGLREIAELRLQHPDKSLAELGALLQEPVGKSGVNHRLRKLSEIAEKLRQKQEENYVKEKCYD